MRPPEIRPMQKSHRIARTSKTKILLHCDRCTNALIDMNFRIWMSRTFAALLDTAGGGPTGEFTAAARSQPESFIEIGKPDHSIDARR